MSDSLQLPEMQIVEVNEGSSFIYTADLVRDDHKPATPLNLDALELTLYENETDAHAIVNNREAQDVLNDNDVTLDERGNLAWNVKSDDNTVLNQNRRCEDHIAQFRIEWQGEGGVARQHYHFVLIRVFNKAKIGA